MSDVTTASKYIKICFTVCRWKHFQIELIEKNTEQKSLPTTVHRHFNGILILTIVMIKSVMRMKLTSQWDYKLAEWSVMGDCYTVMFLGFCGIFHPSFTNVAVFD